ncbi:MAG: glycosyltransferase [Muribaculaceae bacterium]
MKILHVITSLRTGGAEKLMVDLLPRLQKLGDSVDLLVFDGNETPFMQQLASKGINIISLSQGGNVYNPLNIIRLAYHLRDYQIIHTHNTACQLFAPIARLISGAKVQLITTEHSTTNRRRGKWYFKPIDRWMYSKYAHIIAISKKAGELLAQHIGSNDIRIIENGIDIQRYAQAAPIERQLLVPHYTDNDKIITMVAAFRVGKDQDTAIRALTHLPDNIKLCLVGDGERRSDIEALICQLGLQERVRLLGIRSDVPSILRASHIVVLASHWEGLSLSSVEGMASGRPFIASDVDGLREVVANAGLLFPDSDHQELANIILRLNESPEFYNTVAAACAQAARRYDIATTASNYSAIYHLIQASQTTK